MSELLHETRRFPAAKFPWLRVQVGRIETRTMRMPVYGNKSRILRGHEESSKTVSIFRLQGCGETLEQAEAMAKATEGA